jgi:hypothetical protein
MTELTISQALRYSSKLKNQISETRTRAFGSLNHKSGEPTAFSFSEMVGKSEKLSDELANLQGKLAVANATNTINYKKETLTLAHAVKILQELKGRIAWMKTLPCLSNESVTTTDSQWDDDNFKYVKQQVTTLCCLPEADRAEIVDNLQEEFDSLNGAVEALNQTAKLSV